MSRQWPFTMCSLVAFQPLRWQHGKYLTRLFNSLYSKEHVKIIKTHPREIGFVLWGHCQNLLDDPRIFFLFTVDVKTKTHFAESLRKHAYTVTFHGCKNDNFSIKNCDIFLLFAQSINRGYTLEPPLYITRTYEPCHEKTSLLHMRKQRRSHGEADQRLCFRYTDGTIPLLPKSEISSL